MSTPFNAVSAAYNNAARLISQRDPSSTGASGAGTQPSDFGKLLADHEHAALALAEVTIRRADRITVLHGQAKRVALALRGEARIDRPRHHLLYLPLGKWRDVAVLDLEVGCLDEAVFVDAGLGGEVEHQADVGAFWCLDRTNASVVSRVGITNVKTSPLTRETARTHRAEAAFV